MSLQITESREHIYYPPRKIINSEGQKLSIGDLHANAMLLTFVLASHGIITIASEQYTKLRQIYTNHTKGLKDPTGRRVEDFINWPGTWPELRDDHKKQLLADLAEFKKIWSEVTINPTAVGLLELIGDEKGDRGANDYFIDIIVQALMHAGLPVKILLSNHGIEAISSYEHEQISHVTKETIPVRDYSFARLNSSDIIPCQRISALRLGCLIDQGVIDKDEVIDLYSHFYKKCLVAINYSIVNVDGKDTILISTHAPIGLNTIKDLAEHLDVEYNDGSVRDLAATIDSINKQFKQHVEFDTVRLLRSLGRTERQSETNPLQRLIWLRAFTGEQRPFEHNGYQLEFIHGHDTDSEAPVYEHVHNLDGILGKSEQDFFGQYKYLLSPVGEQPQYEVYEKIASRAHADTKLEQICRGEIRAVERSEYNFLLKYAVHIGNMLAVKNLLKVENDVLAKDVHGPFKGYSALMLAALNKNVEVIKILISTHGADDELFNTELKEALYVSLNIQNLNVIEHIVEYKGLDSPNFECCLRYIIDHDMCGNAIIFIQRYLTLYPDDQDFIKKICGRGLVSEEQFQKNLAQVEAAREEAVREEFMRVAEAARVAESSCEEAAREEFIRVAEADRKRVALIEAARVEAARVEAARVEAARVEAARVEAARVEAARVEAARVEAARVEAARVEAAREKHARDTAILYAAAASGHVDEVHHNLSVEIDPNFGDWFEICNKTLMIAAENGHIHIIQLLLEKYSDDNTIRLLPFKIIMIGAKPVVICLICTGTALALCLFAPALMSSIGVTLLGLVKFSATAEVSKVLGSCLIAGSLTLISSPLLNTACNYGCKKIVTSYFSNIELHGLARNVVINLGDCEDRQSHTTLAKA